MRRKWATEMGILKPHLGVEVRPTDRQTQFLGALGLSLTHDWHCGAANKRHSFNVVRFSAVSVDEFMIYVPSMRITLLK